MEAKVIGTLPIPWVGKWSIIDMAYENLDFQKDTFVSSFYSKGHFWTLIVENPDSAKGQMPLVSRLEDCDQ